MVGERGRRWASCKGRRPPAAAQAAVQDWLAAGRRLATTLYKVRGDRLGRRSRDQPQPPGEVVQRGRVFRLVQQRERDHQPVHR